MLQNRNQNRIAQVSSRITIFVSSARSCICSCRITGTCRGLGGSMHIADLDLNILGANGVVGAGIGIGTSAALAAKIRGDGSCRVLFFGDDAPMAQAVLRACRD